MSEPRRLLEGGGSDLERSLLRSARGDAPPPESRRKTLLALGLAGGVGGAGGDDGHLDRRRGAQGLGRAGRGRVIKWIGIGVLTGVAVIGAATMVAPRASPPRAAPSAALVPNPIPTAPAPASRPSPPPPERDPAPAPAPSEEPAPAPKPAAGAPAAPPAATSLTYEVAALDRAREALAAGDAAGALRALDDHDRRFPGGMLGPEATVLRIEALALRGDRASAVRLGKAFLEGAPAEPTREPPPLPPRPRPTHPLAPRPPGEPSGRCAVTGRRRRHPPARPRAGGIARPGRLRRARAPREQRLHGPALRHRVYPRNVYGPALPGRVRRRVRPARRLRPDGPGPLHAPAPADVPRPPLRHALPALRTGQPGLRHGRRPPGLRRQGPLRPRPAHVRAAALRSRARENRAGARATHAIPRRSTEAAPRLRWRWRAARWARA